MSPDVNPSRIHQMSIGSSASTFRRSSTGNCRKRLSFDLNENWLIVGTSQNPPTNIRTTTTTEDNHVNTAFLTKTLLDDKKEAIRLIVELNLKKSKDG